MRPILRRRTGAACALLILLAAGPAGAEEKKETGGLVRHTIMVPLLKKSTQTVVKIIPVIVELTATTDEAKNYFTDRMATLQDAYIQATYGKIFSDIGYDMIAKILEAAVDTVAIEEIKGQYTVNIRVNVRPQ